MPILGCLSGVPDSYERLYHHTGLNKWKSDGDAGEKDEMNFLKSESRIVRRAAKIHQYVGEKDNWNKRDRHFKRLLEKLEWKLEKITLKFAENYIKFGETSVKIGDNCMKIGKSYAKIGQNYVQIGENYMNFVENYVKFGENFIKFVENYIEFEKITWNLVKST